jgi:hypothetical protein
VARISSCLKNNTTLRELTLEISRGATTVSPILISLRDHPLLRRLCLHGGVRDLTGLETVLLNGTSKITELEIRRYDVSPRIIDLSRVLQAFARCPTLTKLGLRCYPLGRDDARLLGTVLGSIPSLHNLVLTEGTLGSAGLVELAPSLYYNTFIKVLDISLNYLSDMAATRPLPPLLCLGINWDTGPALLSVLQTGSVVIQRY